VKRLPPIFLMLITAMLLLSACGGSSETTEPAAPDTAVTDTEAVTAMDEEMADEAMAEHDDEAMADSEETMAESDEMMVEEEMAAETDDTMAGLPEWQTIPLTEVRTGETFTLADFAGKTIFVEPMATWCTNCRRQLGNVSQARAQLNDENVVFVGLSVETNLSDEQLAQYTVDTGFDWAFAVASPEMIQSLVASFGQSITNPPSTPHFVIRPDGSTTDLVTGIEPTDAIVSQIQDAQG